MSEYSPYSDDYQWLVSDCGLNQLQSWFERGSNQADELKLVECLRKEYSASRAAIIANQVLLRDKVRRKFPDYPQILVTEKGLQQSTDSVIAAYKAKRFAGFSAVADLCCGIGGDLFALCKENKSAQSGRQTSVKGIDSDSITASFAQANLRLLELDKIGSSICTTAEEFDLSSFSAFHIDPDRRPGGHRTTHTEFFQPSQAFINRIIGNRCVAVKSAPGADIPEVWEQTSAIEWISRANECRQAVFWFNTEHLSASSRIATTISAEGVACSFTGTPSKLYDYADTIKAYFYDPDPALAASHLSDDFAIKNNLERVNESVIYYTSDTLIRSPLASVFQTRDVLPLDIRKIKAFLKSRSIKTVNIKKRGEVPEPSVLRNKLGLPNHANPNDPVLFIYPHQAVLTTRII